MRWAPVAVGRTATALIVVLGTCSCGVPGDSAVERVDDDAVPYRLLEPTDTSTTGPVELPAAAPAPSLVWLVDDQLVPASSEGTCDGDPRGVVELVLDDLAAGPTDDERSAGRSTAIPPESELGVVDVVDGTASVRFEPATDVSAERLPAAIGQVALAVLSAPGVTSVLVVDPAGEPVAVPVPGGALTAQPVVAEDYLSLVPPRQRPATLGCPDS